MQIHNLDNRIMYFWPPIPDPMPNTLDLISEHQMALNFQRFTLMVGDAPKGKILDLVIT